MKTHRTTTSPRERIIEVAGDLFYRQGYLSTGINQVIEESGVAKATFYTHFASKDDLCVQYLKSVAAQEAQLLESTLESRKSLLSRYLAPIEILEPWLVETNFRGCPFLNIAAEICDENHKIRKIGVDFYDRHKTRIEQLAEDLKRNDPDNYSHLKSKVCAEKYLTILVGAIGLSEIFRSVEPIRNGVRMVKELLK